tara:strand:+ start:4614 stop:5426 length:813 start_codon:yes stop_codon:yes gene_type:complete
MSDELDNLAFRELKTESAIDIAIRNNENSNENFRLSDEEVEKYGNLGRVISGYYPKMSYRMNAPLYSVSEDKDYIAQYFGENAANRDENLELYNIFKSGGGVGSFHVNMKIGERVLNRAWAEIMNPILFPDLEMKKSITGEISYDNVMDESTINFIESNAVLRDKHETDQYFGRMKFAKFTKEYLGLIEDGYISPKKINNLFEKYGLQKLYKTHSNYGSKSEGDVVNFGHGPVETEFDPRALVQPPQWIQEFQDERGGRLVDVKGRKKSL